MRTFQKSMRIATQVFVMATTLLNAVVPTAAMAQPAERAHQENNLPADPPISINTDHPAVFARPEARTVDPTSHISDPVSAQTSNYHTLRCSGGPCGGAPTNVNVSEHFVGTGQVGWGGSLVANTI